MISLDLVKHLAAEHDRRMHRNNTVQVLAIVLGCATLLWYVWTITMLPVRLGLLAILALMVRYSIVWFLQVRRQSAPNDIAITGALWFHRRQLERQRDARSTDWKTWLGCVALAVVLDGLLIAGGAKPWEVPRFVLTLLFSAAALGAYTAFEARERRRLQREIDALDSLGRS